MESSEEAERKEVEKKEEAKCEAQNKLFGGQSGKEQVSTFFVSARKEEDVEEKDRKRSKSRRVKQVLGRSGRWLFLLLILVQNWVCLDAAAGEAGARRGSGGGGNHYRVLDGKSLQEEQMGKLPREWKRSTGVDQRGAQERST